MTAWHTDIVVGGHGFGLKLYRGTYEGAKGWLLEVNFDAESPGARRAWGRFSRDLWMPWDTLRAAKKDIVKAIKRTRANWNKWHRQAY